MAISSTHPQYTTRLVDWEQTSDCYKGQRNIKEKGQKYLPATAGMIADGMANTTDQGYIDYMAYLMRAYFPDLFRDAIETHLGIMHRKPPVIKVPKRLEPMLQNISTDSETAEMLLRRINEFQLRDGRLGLLLEMPDGLGPTSLPFIALYPAARVRNWDVGRIEQGRQEIEMVVIEETEYERTADLDWVLMQKWRMLARTSEMLNVMGTDQKALPQGSYVSAEFRGDGSLQISSGNFKSPSIAGNILDFVPFTFINVKDLAPEPDLPPLIGLSNLVLAIYRGEADYRQSLFSQGQETLVIIGAGEVDEKGKETRVGTGAKIELPLGADAKYIGLEGKGLQEQRQALENDYDMAKQQGSRMLSTKGGDQQSGDALHTRVAGMTATLPNIARAGAYALETQLKYAAIAIGEDPKQVSVVPNLDFAADVMTGQTMLQMMQAKQLGFPLSRESIHANLVKQNLTDKTFDEEEALIEDETPVLPPAGARGTTGLPKGAQPNPGENTGGPKKTSK